MTSTFAFTRSQKPPPAAEPREELLAFTRRLVAIRKAQPALRRRHFVHGRPVRGTSFKDVYWARPDGREMTGADWDGPHLAFSVGLVGDQLEERDARGERIKGDTLLLLVNGRAHAQTFLEPEHSPGSTWEVLADTARPEQEPMLVSRFYDLPSRSLALLRLVTGVVVPDSP